MLAMRIAWLVDTLDPARIAPLVATGLLCLLAIAGSWYVGREQGRKEIAPPTRVVRIDRMCQTLPLANANDLTRLEELQGQGWQIAGDEPGEDVRHMVTLCR
jgi:hypothetical protein